MKEIQNNGTQYRFIDRSEIMSQSQLNYDLLDKATRNPRPVVLLDQKKIYSFYTFSQNALKLKAHLCQIVSENQETTIIMDHYASVVDAMILDDDLLSVFLKGLLEDIYSSFYTFEDEIMQLETDISLGLLDGINLDLLSSIKRDCLIAEKETRRLGFVVQDIIQDDNHHLSRTIIHIHDTAKYLVEYVQHLMLLYNSIINEKTNKTINKLTAITVFVAPVTILSGVYGMNFLHMPGIRLVYGYYVMVAIMLLLMILIYYYLKKKRIL